MRFHHLVTQANDLISEHLFIHRRPKSISLLTEMVISVSNKYQKQTKKKVKRQLSKESAELIPTAIYVHTSEGTKLTTHGAK